MFKKTLLAGAVAATLFPGVAPAADSPHTITGNVGLYSQYIFRGLTQTNREPAIQGGFDYSHSGGFYAGTWASNISWLRDSAAYRAGGSGEFDFYGGYKAPLWGDFTFDLGTLYYWYPGDASLAIVNNTGAPKADTWELYTAVSWKWITAKLSSSLDNKTFGVLDSRGTYYFDLTANFPLTKELSLIGHWGKQKFAGTDRRNPVVGTRIQDNDSVWSYEDWKIGLSYALPKDFPVGVFYTDTSGGSTFAYGVPSDAVAGPYPRNISKGTGTVFIQKTF